MAGNGNQISMQNISPNHGFGKGVDPITAQKIGHKVMLQRGMIRRAALEAMETGQVVINSKDVELFDQAGNKINIEFATAKLKVPNYMAIGMALMKEAKGGDTKAIEILIKLDENYENRKLKLQQKDTKIKEDILEHFKKIQIVDSVEEGEVIPYEELNRSID